MFSVVLLVGTESNPTVIMFYRVDRKVTVVINEHHTHEVTAVAEVVPKTLTLDPKAVEIKTIEDPFSPNFYALRVGSGLSTPVNFSWDIPPDSAFKIEPLCGVRPY